MVENLKTDMNSNRNTANSMKGLTRPQGSFRLMVDSSLLTYPGRIDINQLQSYLSEVSKKWYEANIKIDQSKKDTDTILNTLKSLMNAHVVETQSLSDGIGLRQPYILVHSTTNTSQFYVRSFQM